MDERKEGTGRREIDLKVVLNVLKRHIIPLLLVTAIFGSGFYVYSRFFITKKYEASATLIVNNLNKNKSTRYFYGRINKEDNEEQWRSWVQISVELHSSFKFLSLDFWKGVQLLVEFPLIF